MRFSKPIGFLGLILVGSLSLSQISQATTVLPAGYENLDGCSKQSLLWSKYIATSPYSTLPRVTGSWTTLMTKISSLLFLHETFDHFADIMPVGREKVIHSHGSTAAVELTNDATSPFSGIFAPGTACGLARISLAGSPTSLGFTPGMGLKIFVKGSPSVNFQVMNSLNGQGNDQNIFAKSFTNRLPAASGIVLNGLVLAIAVTGHDLTHLPIDSAAAVLRTDGRRENAPVELEQIAFSPVNATTFAGSRQDFRVQLASLPAGTKIYQVFGLLNNKWIKFASLKITSKFIASKFGDEQLFFRHAE